MDNRGTKGTSGTLKGILFLDWGWQEMTCATKKMERNKNITKANRTGCNAVKELSP